jgi:hypothetical protein
MQQIAFTEPTTSTIYKVLYTYSSNRYKSGSPHTFTLSILNNNYDVAILDFNIDQNALSITLNNHTLKYSIIQLENTVYLHSSNGNLGA